MTPPAVMATATKTHATPPTTQRVRKDRAGRSTVGAWLRCAGLGGYRRSDIHVVSLVGVTSTDISSDVSRLPLCDQEVGALDVR
jgi:hypothetical protein